MEHVADDYEPGIPVACRDNFPREPLVRLLPPFPSFHRSQVFHVVPDDKIWPVLVMPKSTDALFRRGRADTRAELREDERGRSPFVGFFFKWSKVVPQKLVSLKFALQVHHMLFGLAPSLAENQHKLFLLFAQDRPNRIGHCKNSGFTRPTESDDKQIPDVIPFR